MLRPASLALVGASTRRGSVGNVLVRQALQGGFGGRLYPVNPRHAAVEGVPCHPSLARLPEPVDHAVLALGDERIEGAVEQAAACGVRAITIFSSLLAGDGREPPPMQRIRERAREAGILLCGPMSMGLYNFPHGLWVCGFDTRADHRAGGVTLITQSGSVLSSLVDAEARIDYNLVVSSGRELTLTTADYLDFALAEPTTRVVGLFLETVRDPERFRGCLEEANRRGIPVVALKVGRTEHGARLAKSHSGAMVGDDAAYRALFERYGVVQVRTLEELAVTLMLFAQPHPVGAGGLATIHDSGGERALLADLAADAGVPFAALSPPTLERLRERLDPGLPATNPLDAWGTGRDYHGVFNDCFAAMMADPGTALGAVVCDRGPEGQIFPEYPEFVRAGHAASGKPTFLLSNHQGSGFSADAIALTREGFPVLDGVVPFLAGVRHLLDYRAFLERPPPQPPAVDTVKAGRWRVRLAEAAEDPRVALDLLAAFDLPVVPHLGAGSREGALAAAAQLGYPVVLKTRAGGAAHKWQQGGVRLDLRGPRELERAYDAMAATFGPRTLVAPLVEPAVELMLGAARDPQLGPVVVLGAGGVHAEVLGDVAFALPPFDACTARRLLARLRVHRLLEGEDQGGGERGGPRGDVGAFCQAAARFSAMAAALPPALASLDANPVAVRAQGCVVLDARVVTAEGDGGAQADAAARPAPVPRR